MFRFLLLFLICSLFTINSLAQADTTVSYYLDDGGISTTKNAIKTNLPSLISGNALIIYERKFGDGFSLEAGIGLQLPYYNPGIVELSIGSKDFEGEVEGGYNIWFMPKFLSEYEYYNAILYERRTFNLQSQDVVFNDISYIFGYHTTIGNWISLDIGTGIGWRIISREISVGETEENTIIVPINLEIGYKFN